MAGPASVRRVLVANGDPFLRTYLERALVVLECCVNLCDGARRALAAVEDAPYDLVILDVEKSSAGMDVVREIRSRGHRVPILLMSGTQGSESDPSWEDSDDVQFLRKPFGLSELRESVARMLGR